MVLRRILLSPSERELLTRGAFSNYGTGRHTHIVHLSTNNIKEKDEYVFHVTIDKFAKFKDISEATPATLTAFGGVLVHKDKVSDVFSGKYGHTCSIK